MHRSIILLFLFSVILVEFSNSYLISKDMIGYRSGNPGEKQCAKVGEFCINHSDCCSNGCLGYKRRCVSS